MKPATPGCNLRAVIPGRYYRSDALTGLSPEIRTRVDALGLTTVVDLRSPSERFDHPCDLERTPGVRYCPVDLSGGLRRNSGSVLGGVPHLGELYVKLLDHCWEDLAQTLRLLARSPGPALFHCSAGKDRTGVVAMLVLGLAGADDETMMRDYLATKEAIVPILPFLASTEAIRTGGPAALAFLETEARFLEAALARIHRTYGGFEAYVRGPLGLEESDVRALKAGILS